MASCGFEGNADIYGIGIRLGYYTQILAVWFSNYFYFRDAKSLRAVNNIFLLALIVGGFIYFRNAETIYAIEAFLLLQIGVVIGLVCITESTRYTSKYRDTSRERLVLRMAIMIFGAFFNVTFWWKGLDVMMPTPCEGSAAVDYRAATYIFFFSKADIYAWVRILVRVTSIFAAVLTAPTYACRDAAVLLYDLRMEKTRTSFVKAVAALNIIRKPGSDLDGDLEGRQPYTVSCRHTRNYSGSTASRHFVSSSRAGSPHPSTILPAAATKDIILIAKSKDDLEGDCEILTSVEKADKYIKSLLSIYTTTTSSPEQKRVVYPLGGCLPITANIPEKQKTQCNDTTPYTHCILNCLKSIITNTPSLSLRDRVALHLYAIGAPAPWKWPRYINHIYQLSKTDETPDWRHLNIASDLQLSQIPVSTSTAKWAFGATQQFVFIALLIVQVELTIAWNHVSGLQRLTSLGQLIPFILGMGGLVKVLWGKGQMVWRGEKEGREVGEGEYEMAMARYLEWKNGGREPGIIRMATV